MQARGAAQDIYSLTPMQEGMFFHTLKEPGSAVYITQVSYRLEGTVDPARVAESLAVLVRRHDILRTAFVQEGLSQPFQVVLRERPLAVHYEDLGDLAPDEAAERVAARKAQDRTQPFRLDRDPLMRVSVLRVAAGAYEFTWSYHHILMDGWCVTVLVNEFYAIYHGLQTGVPPQLPQPVAYGAYVRWLEKKDRRAAQTYWQTYTAGLDAATRLPDLGRTASPAAYENADCYFTLNAAQVQGLRDLAGRSGVTINSVLQTLWGVLLAKYNDHRDVVFGTVVSGRPAHLEGIERAVGLFINAVPVRVQYAAGTRFADLLQTVQGAALAGEPHHYFPLADIQAGSALKGNLVNHIFVFENYPVSNLLTEATGAGEAGTAYWQVTAADGFARTNYDFNVNVAPAGDEMIFRFDWHRARFDADVPVRMGRHYQYLADQVLRNPQAVVDELALLDGAETGHLLDLGTGPVRQYTAHATIAQVFAETAARHPEKPAVVHNGIPWTYRQLDESSDRVAHHLQTDLGVRPGDCVGVLLDRSAETVLSLLAVLKAGGVYVPIDPDYPEDRIAFMLADAEAPVLVTQSSYLFKAGSFGGRFFATDLELDGLPAGTRPQPVAPEMAYVIYTSGTTGRPKGVLIRQESIIDRILFHNDYLPVTEADVVLQFASAGFDASLVEILMALFAGATVVVADGAVRQNLALLADTMEAYGVTVAILPPAYLHILDKHPLPSLRKLISAGEAARTEESLFYARTKDFFNGYGPTETCVGASFHRLDPARGDAYRTGGIPIGQPFANTTILVLDAGGKLVPRGVAGEICVAGKGLSAGYLHQPELTARAFRPNPYARHAGEATLYRTGDLGRWNAAGELEYRGRRDEQVQLNGMRVETGEIESRLATLDGVQGAAVTAQTDAAGQTYLIAYVVSRTPVTVGTVRAGLGRFLPVHMLPAWVIALDELPLSANGKVDKKALPPADLAELGKMSQYEPPAGETERRLAAIWGQVLDRTDLGVLDNFFAAGGQSLKATQIVSRIYKEFKTKVELNDLFAHPTIRELAAVVAGKQPGAYQRLTPAEPRPHYPLSPAQKRLWMLDQFAGTKSAYNVAGSYRLTGPLDERAFERSFYQLIERHESLRTRFVLAQGEPVQQIVPAGESSFVFGRADLREAPDAEARAEALAQAEAERPFDLQAGPLLRATLVRTADDGYLFLLTLHHIVSDGWSMEVLVRDVFAHYAAGCAGTEPALPPLTVHYKEYTLWQARQLSGPALEAHREYWLGQFREPVPALALPTDFPRPAYRRYRGKRVTHTFPEAQVAGLQAYSRREGATSFVTLVALLGTLLHEITGQTDLVLGSVISGRQHEQLEDQIGLYTNTIALRTRFGADEPFATLLHTAKSAVLGAYQYQLYPFEQLTEEVNRANPAGPAPLFNVMITHRNLAATTMHQQVDTHGLRVEPGPEHAATSRFDLIFGFVEHGHHLNLAVEYDTDLFRPETIATWVAQLDILLEKALAAPHTPVGAFGLQAALAERYAVPAALVDFDIELF